MIEPITISRLDMPNAHEIVNDPEDDQSENFSSFLIVATDIIKNGSYDFEELLEYDFEYIVSSSNQEIDSDVSHFFIENIFSEDHLLVPTVFNFINIIIFKNPNASILEADIDESTNFLIDILRSNQITDENFYINSIIYLESIYTRNPYSHKLLKAKMSINEIFEIFKYKFLNNFVWFLSNISKIKYEKNTIEILNNIVQLHSVDLNFHEFMELLNEHQKDSRFMIDFVESDVESFFLKSTIMLLENGEQTEIKIFRKTLRFLKNLFVFRMELGINMLKLFFDIIQHILYSIQDLNDEKNILFFSFCVDFLCLYFKYRDTNKITSFDFSGINTKIIGKYLQLCSYSKKIKLIYILKIYEYDVSPEILEQIQLIYEETDEEIIKELIRI